MRKIELSEYSDVYLPEEALSAEAGELIWRRWSGKIDVDFPTPKTDRRWKLRSLGWVGTIPVDERLTLTLTPKVPLENLFRMLEYAYDLSIHFEEGLTECDSLSEFYERLAKILARRIIDRGRRGLYRSYIDRNEVLPYLRGRPNVQSAIRRPWNTKLECRFEEQTPDLEEYQILLWTLSRILHSGQCSGRVRPTVARAYRSLVSAVSLLPFDPPACAGRLYNRLNDDYEPMLSLCRFFLEHTGPTHRSGDRTMLPFLIDMARLFEVFVARWLRDHLPRELRVRDQETVTVGAEGELRFEIDLLLSDRQTGRILSVLDTKYKQAGSPSNADINEVAVYAMVKDCGDAFLIYPAKLPRTFDAAFESSGIRVRTLAFPLDGDLESAGETFLQTLLEDSGRLGSPRLAREGAGDPEGG